MQERETRVLIMAAGTGGHIIPALAIADRLQRLGAEVHWLGTPAGLEQKLLRNTNIPLHIIRVSGLRDRGWWRLLLAPLMLLRSLSQALSVLRRINPHCVLGMGGYVSGPGGIAARLHGCRLLIHEQNAVAGLTNRILARLAHRVMTAFPDTFPQSRAAIVTGNPVRIDITPRASVAQQDSEHGPQLRLLVLGGSQGALAINAVVPELISAWSGSTALQVWHQCGERHIDDCKARYAAVGLDINEQYRLESFIEDMAQAYHWADIVLCRSGASTVFELAAAGLPSLLVPYPYHSDHQQEKNAQWLVDLGAAKLVSQDKLTAVTVNRLLQQFASERSMLAEMGERALSGATPEAADVIARQCLEVVHGH